MAENQEVARMVCCLLFLQPAHHILTVSCSHRLVCAKRRLTWKEIQVALSIDVDRQIIDYEYQHLRDHIYVTCGSLVVVTGDRVSLVHSTAKTYVLSHAFESFPT